MCAHYRPPFLKHLIVVVVTNLHLIGLLCFQASKCWVTNLFEGHLSYLLRQLSSCPVQVHVQRMFIRLNEPTTHRRLLVSLFLFSLFKEPHLKLGPLRQRPMPASTHYLLSLPLNSRWINLENTLPL